MRRLTVLAIPLLAVLTLGACSDDSDNVTAGSDDGGGDPTTTVPGPQPTGKDAKEGGLVITIVDGGGFVPVEWNFTNQPSVAIYADGTVLTPGVVPTIFPGPALWPLTRSTITPERVLELVQQIRDADVIGADYGQPGIADASTTTLTIYGNHAPQVASAYALSFEDDPQYTPAQKEARKRLSDLVAELTNPAGATQAGEYRPDALAVLVRPVDPGTADPEVQPNELDWPLADLSSGGVEAFGGRCIAVTGADAARVLDTLGEATQITRWNSGGKQWSLAFKAMLPGEAPCAPES